MRLEDKPKSVAICPCYFVPGSNTYMPLFKSRAIVLKGINLGESDRIITFFTRDFGKVQGVAKVARRTKSKFGASLEPLTLSNLIFFGKENANLYRINSVDIIEPFNSNREDYEKLVRSLYLTDIINTFILEHDPNVNLFNLLERTIRHLGVTRRLEKLDTILSIFQIKLLAGTGYAPSLMECVFCKDYLRVASCFNLERGGVVCEKCMKESRNSFYVSPGILNFMRRVTTCHPQILSRIIINSRLNNEVNILLGKYLRIHTGKSLKYLKFIEKANSF